MTQEFYNKLIKIAKVIEADLLARILKRAGYKRKDLPKIRIAKP